MRSRCLTGLIAGLALICGASPADVRGGPVTIYVGYADNLRPNPFFPNPWDGSPNTTFLGSTTPGTIFDAGAVLIQNTSGSAITVNDVSVSGFANGATFDLWGTPGALANNSYMILTQTTTNDSQFDTSDQLPGFTYPDNPGSGYTPAHPYTGNPQVAITINGALTTYSDTGHVLDTGGYDSATWPFHGNPFVPNNESLQWRPIGTTGIGDPGGNPPGVPEPATLTMLSFGMVSLAVYLLRRRKSSPPRP